VIAGQIDCLFQTADGRWTLIDYKTGRLPLTQPGAIVEKYGVQMALYALAARELLGRLPDTVEIVAVHDEVRRYRVEVSKAFLAAISRRVDSAVAQLRGAE
jgi:ATP-dependent exoDNAse (exonuclease V) beta subunit